MGQFSFVMDSFIKILNMSFAASFVIIVVILARLVLKKAPKVFSYLLWGVVLIRLICPLTIESELSLLPVNANPISPSIIYDAVPEIDSGIATLDRIVNESLSPATPYASMNPMQGNVLIYSLLWGMVAVAMLLYAAISYIILKVSLRPAMLVNGNVYESEKVTSPFVLGILRPRIYMPIRVDEGEYSYIVAHEQTHIRRLDHIVKVVAYMALCLHWFNPLCWLAFVMMTRDMEMSCDEAVIKRLGSGIRRDYSASLLALSGYRLLINGSPIAFCESGVKGRIKNIMNYKRPTAWAVTIAAVVLLGASVGLLLSPEQDTPPVVDLPSSNSQSSISAREKAILDAVTASNSDGVATVIIQPSEYYTLLLNNKQSLTDIVSQRVEEYRNGTQPDNPNHHPKYPSDFPPASKLPVVILPGQFAVRDEGNPDAMGSVYVAVAIDDRHEMRMTVSQYIDDDGIVRWGSGDTFFVAADDPSFRAWLLSDVAIHSDLRPINNGLTMDEYKSLTNMSFSPEQIASMPREEIDFIFYTFEAAGKTDAQGFTTLDFTQLSSMDESAEHTWVRAGDSILGMTVKSVYVKGVPYGGYVQATLEEKVVFTGYVTIRGRFVQNEGLIEFRVEEKSQKLIPSHYPYSDTIRFLNQQTARVQMSGLVNADTDCEITIDNYQIELSNDSIVPQLNELGEIVDYTMDQSKDIGVQWANIV